MALPCELVATHLYTPLSEGWTLVTDNTDTPRSLVSIVRRGDVVKGMLLWSHEIVGGGSPSTEHMKVVD